MAPGALCRTVPTGKPSQIHEVKHCYTPQHSLVWPHSTGRDGHKKEVPRHLTSHIWEHLLPWYPHYCIPEWWPLGFSVCWGTPLKCDLSVEMSHFILLCSEAEELWVLMWVYLLVTLPQCLSWSGPEVVKEHLFPIWITLWLSLRYGIAVMLILLCAQVLSLQPTLLWGGLQIMCFTFGCQKGWDTTTSRELLTQYGRRNVIKKKKDDIEQGVKSGHSCKILLTRLRE